MTFVVAPGRPNSRVSQAYALWEKEKRSEKKASKSVAKPEVGHPKENVLESPAYERNAKRHLVCRHCGKKPLFPQFCHRDEGKGKGIKTDVREGWVGCGPNLKTSEPGCHWLIGTSGTFTKAERRALDLQYGASTRTEMLAKGLWPKNLPKWAKGGR